MEAVEADLLRFYHLDLADLGTPGMSYRRLRILVEHLPQHAALNMKLQGKDALWGLPEHLMAAIYDTLQGANWQRGGGKGQKPTPLPRPGERKDEKKIGGNVAYTPVEIDAIFAATETPEEVTDGS